MTNVPDLGNAFAALDGCRVAVEELDAKCCEPGRSPRMKALATTLDAARSKLRLVADDTDVADAALAELEDAGAQVGRLQVGCCAPNRLPLYASILENLTEAQLTLNRELGRGH